MSVGLRLFLIAGCVLVTCLELPHAIPTVRAAFDGPYPNAALDTYAAATESPVAELEELTTPAMAAADLAGAPRLPLAVPASSALALLIVR